MQKLLLEAFLLEWPHETIDYELERFTRKYQTPEKRFEELKSFFKYLLVGDEYHTNIQPSVNLAEIRDHVWEDLDNKSFEFWFRKNWKKDYKQFLQEIKTTANRDEVSSYKAVIDFLSKDREEKGY